MIVKASSSITYSKTSDSFGKHRKRYVDNPKDRTKLTCLIHGHGNSSDEFKVLGDFGNKYD